MIFAPVAICQDCRLYYTILIQIVYLHRVPSYRFDGFTLLLILITSITIFDFKK